MTKKTTESLEDTGTTVYDGDAGIVQRIIAKLDPLLQLEPKQFGELREGSLYLVLSDIESDLTGLLGSMVGEKG